MRVGPSETAASRHTPPTSACPSTSRGSSADAWHEKGFPIVTTVRLDLKQLNGPIWATLIPGASLTCCLDIVATRRPLDKQHVRKRSRARARDFPRATLEHTEPERRKHGAGVRPP